MKTLEYRHTHSHIGDMKDDEQKNEGKTKLNEKTCNAKVKTKRGTL